MSWQRILEVARRQRLPLIVTDPAGREPLVVLSLEAFEGLADRSSDAMPRPASSLDPRMDQERIIPLKEETSIHRADAASSAATESAVSSIDISVVSTPLVDERGEASDLALEERFYLEPLEDI